MSLRVPMFKSQNWARWCVGTSGGVAHIVEFWSGNTGERRRVLCDSYLNAGALYSPDSTTPDCKSCTRIYEAQAQQRKQRGEGSAPVAVVRCSRCDRADCASLRPPAVLLYRAEPQRCDGEPVDWRARCLDAESRLAVAERERGLAALAGMLANAVARRALRECRHSVGCAWVRVQGDACTCGVDTALKVVGKGDVREWLVALCKADAEAALRSLTHPSDLTNGPDGFHDVGPVIDAALLDPPALDTGEALGPFVRSVVEACGGVVDSFGEDHSIYAAGMWALKQSILALVVDPEDLVRRYVEGRG